MALMGLDSDVGFTGCKAHSSFISTLSLENQPLSKDVGHCGRRVRAFPVAVVTQILWSVGLRVEQI